jgi:hypothetical protein
MIARIVPFAPFGAETRMNQSIAFADEEQTT